MAPAQSIAGAAAHAGQLVQRIEHHERAADAVLQQASEQGTGAGRAKHVVTAGQIDGCHYSHSRVIKVDERKPNAPGEQVGIMGGSCIAWERHDTRRPEAHAPEAEAEEGALAHRLQNLQKIG